MKNLYLLHISDLLNNGVARKLGFSGESPYRFLAYQKRDGCLARE